MQEELTVAPLCPGWLSGGPSGEQAGLDSLPPEVALSFFLDCLLFPCVPSTAGKSSSAGAGHGPGLLGLDGGLRH